jgi:tRNA pseudouridine55 synthase
MTVKNLIINLNKPKGMTSQQAVTKTKLIFNAKKAGHAGTLDPLATGILLVCLDEATKITRFLADADKEYIVVMKFGERTDTMDAEGRIIQKVENFSLDINQINSALTRFKGEIEQVPPVYSAIKVSGTPMYKLARRGIDVQLKPRTITIKELEVISYSTPLLELRVLCSKGTYIRKLCDDIGTTLGIGAYVVDLTRTCIEGFKLSDSAALNELPLKKSSLYTIDSALKKFIEVVLTENDCFRFKNGLSIRDENYSKIPLNSIVRVKDPDGKLFAVGKVFNSEIRVDRLLNLIK